MWPRLDGSTDRKRDQHVLNPLFYCKAYFSDPCWKYSLHLCFTVYKLLCFSVEITQLWLHFLTTNVMLYHWNCVIFFFFGRGVVLLTLCMHEFCIFWNTLFWIFTSHHPHTLLSSLLLPHCLDLNKSPEWSQACLLLIPLLLNTKYCFTRGVLWMFGIQSPWFGIRHFP